MYFTDVYKCIVCAVKRVKIVSLSHNLNELVRVAAFDNGIANRTLKTLMKIQRKM